MRKGSIKSLLIQITMDENLRPQMKGFCELPCELDPIDRKNRSMMQNF